jgi:DNA-binding transcriptional LysR family regulator
MSIDDQKERMDDLRSLRHFVEIARHGSFAAAAAKFGLSATAMSKSIARTEQALGVRLLTRTTRSVRLTGEGQFLFDKLAPSFERIEESVDRVGTVRSEPAGLVRISTSTGFGEYWILPLLPVFLARYPRISLELSVHNFARGLSRQEYDVRISWGERAERDKVARTLCRLPFILIASADYLARCGTPRTPEELAGHECIIGVAPDGSTTSWTFTKRGARRTVRPVEVVPKARIVVREELSAILHAVRAGLGISMAVEHMVRDELKKGTLVRLLPDYDVQSYGSATTDVIIQYSSRKHLPARVRHFVDFLVENLSDVS